jgi:hypothetical protein
MTVKALGGTDFRFLHAIHEIRWVGHFACAGEIDMWRFGFSAAALGCFCLTTALALPPELERLENWAAAIRPKASETKWEKIPWITDLPNSIKVASREQRPMVVWASGDAPLERC